MDKITYPYHNRSKPLLITVACSLTAQNIGYIRIISYPTMHHSEQRFEHFCSEWCILGFGKVHCGICESGQLNFPEYGFWQHWDCKCIRNVGIIWGMGSASERRCYIVTSSLIGSAHIQKDPRWWIICNGLVYHVLHPTGHESFLLTPSEQTGWTFGHLTHWPLGDLNGRLDK